MEKAKPHCPLAAVKRLVAAGRMSTGRRPRPTTPAGDVYLKLTVMDDVLLVSFKEL
jgi:hypothetical protein